MASKKELDALIAKAGVGKRTAKKLHEANGTDGTEGSTPETPQPRKSGGHGSARIEKPDFGL